MTTERDHAPSVAAPADPLLEAWRQYTIRFATEPEVRNSETSIRDAFAAGWDAAALRAESVAAPPELREAATRYVEDVEAGKDPRPTWQSLREAVRAARHAPPALDAALDTITAAIEARRTYLGWLNVAEVMDVIRGLRAATPASGEPAQPMTAADGRHPDHYCGQEPCPHLIVPPAAGAEPPR